MFNSVQFRFTTQLIFSSRDNGTALSHLRPIFSFDWAGHGIGVWIGAWIGVWIGAWIGVWIGVWIGAWIGAWDWDVDWGVDWAWIGRGLDKAMPCLYETQKRLNFEGRAFSFSSGKIEIPLSIDFPKKVVF